MFALSNFLEVLTHESTCFARGRSCGTEGICRLCAPVSTGQFDFFTACYLTCLPCSNLTPTTNYELFNKANETRLEHLSASNLKCVTLFEDSCVRQFGGDCIWGQAHKLIQLHSSVNRMKKAHAAQSKWQGLVCNGEKRPISQIGLAEAQGAISLQQIVMFVTC